VLVESLGSTYLPVGVVEEALVQTIATTLWRKARVIRAENGEIRKQLDTLRVDRALRNSDKGNLDLAMLEMDLGLYNAENPADGQVSTVERWTAMQTVQGNLQEHRSGLEYLTALLEIAKSQIQSDGYVSEKVRKKIFFAFCFKDHFFAINCLLAGPPPDGTEEQPSEKGVNRPGETANAEAIAFIENRLEKLG
jgi:hypothetical protein